jgi:hypothetical protein
MTEDARDYEWPEDPVQSVEEPAIWKLVLLYGLPVLLLLVFPAVAWIGLFPGAVGLRWATHPPHRRRLVALYVLTGLFSVAPWIAMLLGRDTVELS